MYRQVGTQGRGIEMRESGRKERGKLWGGRKGGLAQEGMSAAAQRQSGGVRITLVLAAEAPRATPAPAAARHLRMRAAAQQPAQGGCMLRRSASSRSAP